MEITAREKNLKELGEIKKNLYDLCNLGLLKERVTSSPILWPWGSYLCGKEKQQKNHINVFLLKIMYP